MAISFRAQGLEFTRVEHLKVASENATGATGCQCPFKLWALGPKDAHFMG
jgi:hypothetical protein